MVVGLKYISVDGDDIGRKIASCYFGNRSSDLENLSKAMSSSTEQISSMLQGIGFDVIFCAADGVVANVESEVDFDEVFCKVDNLAPEGITFSAGVGNSLRESYIALMTAKSNGKHCLINYESLSS